MIGRTLSHYRVLEKIGVGGMGEVYRAHDEHLQRDVALKVLPAGMLDDEAARKRFRKEALALSKLNHPNIATVHDFDSQQGVDILVMEYVEGHTLAEKLETGSLPEKEIARLGLELAEGLASAHERGIIHRDLKPANLKLTPEGRLKILDFGLAKLVQPEAHATDLTEPVTQLMSETEPGMLVGTLPYMAPEQVRGEKVDARSDIWAAGLVLFEAATGRRAFSKTHRAELMSAILRDAPPSPSGLNKRLSPGLDAIVAKCLEKDPEHRYQSARELIVDLRRLGMASSVQTRAPQTSARKWIVAGSLALLTLAGGFLAWSEGWLSRSQALPTSPEKKDWILVAEFDGPPEDSSLAVTTRDLVSAALDQSQIVATVPRDQIRLALKNAGKPAGARVDAELAKELAYRSAVRAVLEGKVGRLGAGYSVVLRVVDAESLNVILTENTVAKNQDDLIPTLVRAAEKVLEGLGEKRSAIQALRPRSEISTPSFEAYRLMAQASRVFARGTVADAIPIMRDALALDPDFAVAWWYLGICLGNVDLPDSALAAYDEALRRPQRLTLLQRLNVEGFRASAAGDARGSLAAFQRVLQYDANNHFALVSRAPALMVLGRFEEALESNRKAERTSPFGATQVMRNNEVIYLCALGRFDEAREIVRHIQGPQNGLRRIYIEAATKNWAVVEQLVDSLLAEPNVSMSQREEALLHLVSAQGTRGAFKSASGTLDRVEKIAQSAALSTFLHAAYRSRLMLTTISPNANPLPPDPGADDSSAATCLTRGLRAATAGDRAEAHDFLMLARTRSRHEQARERDAAELLAARIESMGGQWGEAVRILSPIASGSSELGKYPAGLPMARWFLADAWVQLDQAESAAVMLEKITSDPMTSGLGDLARGFLLPFAHRRLVLLYADMNRIADAKRHWQIFTEMVHTPDPELEPLIAEARQALLHAESSAKATH